MTGGRHRLAIDTSSESSEKSTSFRHFNGRFSDEKLASFSSNRLTVDGHTRN